MNTTRIHTFDSTQEAYDACQCDESIKDGDILLIPSEGVVGLAGTWPVAVTVKYGELHMKEPTRFWLDVPRIENLPIAVMVASAHGFDVDAQDCEVLGTDFDGGDICWNAITQCVYNGGRPE